MTPNGSLHFLDFCKQSVQDMGKNDSSPAMNPSNAQIPLSSMFLGPKAENSYFWAEMFNGIFSDYVEWRKNNYPEDPMLIGAHEKKRNDEYFDLFRVHMQETLNELKTGVPFHSPRYLGHMLSGQTLPAVMGYFAGMLFNSNNVTEEAAPVTVKKELEFGKMICRMIGYSQDAWAHICSGGTVANLEALWVARQAQFMPLVIKDICIRKKWDFSIRILQSDESVSISTIGDKTLLSMPPDESMHMVLNLLKYLTEIKGLSAERAHDELDAEIKASQYNIKYRGIADVLSKVQLKPVLFVPESAHYSFKKAANILGYGEYAIRSVPVDGQFRMNVNRLEELIHQMRDDEYIAAVVAVAGTTEEGAVDPVHKVKWLRDRLAREVGISFWLHVDAAHGGYIRTLFCDAKEDESIESMEYNEVDFWGTVNAWMKRIETVDAEVFGSGNDKNAGWTSRRDVVAAFMSIHAADSVTIDPHKMGYIPYPAGLVAFKSKSVTRLVAQDAAYISTSDSSITQIEIPEIDAVGSYILEGSKPGAAALSCWLAAKMIPLDYQHHGKIIKSSLLSAQKLANCLKNHKTHTFRTIDDEFFLQGEFNRSSAHPFSFELIYNNIDTNIVCFVVVPSRWKKDESQMEFELWGLEAMNRFNRIIYDHFSYNRSPHDAENPEAFSRSFFLSHTELKKGSYEYESISDILKKFGITKREYEQHGLFVLRSTVMNPWYPIASYGSNADNRIDYFMEFIKQLHYVSRSTLESLDFIMAGFMAAHTS